MARKEGFGLSSVTGMDKEGFRISGVTAWIRKAFA